jgi:hypothetical protein
MKAFVNGLCRGRLGGDEGRVLYVEDVVALEPAQKTLLLVAAERRALAAPFPPLEGGLRGDCAGQQEAVEVSHIGDEGVRRQREQQQTCRRARPPEPLRLFTQLFAQTCR